MGIIGGLYFNIVPFIFLTMIFLNLILKSFNFRINNNYFKILNLFIKNNMILVFLISAFISSIYLEYCNKRYEMIYKNFSCKEIIGTIISNNKETEYKDIYKIKLEENQKINILLRISKSKEITLNYGDKIKVKGEYIVPESSRNHMGFNYKEYLKTQKIYGIYEADNLDVLCHGNLSKVELLANELKQKIINNINKILPESTKDLFLGILIGYDDNLGEEIQEIFRKSSLTHLLAVSGAHIVYIITGIKFLFSKLNIPKRITLIFTIIFLVFFMYITDFSSSVVRASIMGIILLLSLTLFKKNDIYISISISILLILIENPYKVLDIGLILSVFATIGIICFSSMINKNNKEKNNIYEKIIEFLKDIALVTIFANIFVMPIILYNFNTISLTFIISNLIAGILIGPITIFGFILIILSILNIKLAYVFGIIYNLLLELLIRTTKLTSIFPMSEVLVPTPNIFIIFIYYLILTIYILYIFLKKEYSNRYIVKKIINNILKFINLLKKNYKIIFIFCTVLIVIFVFISKMIPKDLKIYFIDVGQGDSTLVITPLNKKIIIDSGGSEIGDFDGGKSTLVPYLLDRRIMDLEYICISHFDSDHCKNFIYLLNNIKVKNIILSKQHESTSNFKEIINIARIKNINILKVEEGDIIQIDKYVRIKILGPAKQLTNDINDNSIVMKLEYFNFSCLFTGDISKQIEKNLVKKYGKLLKSTVIKVAHHGSSTSSDNSFIQTVNPAISLIGVGKNNKFGHPNTEVIEILESIKSRIYRTDIHGEIILKINRKRNDRSKHLY